MAAQEEFVDGDCSRQPGFLDGLLKGFVLLALRLYQVGQLIVNRPDFFADGLRKGLRKSFFRKRFQIQQSAFERRDEIRENLGFLQDGPIAQKLLNRVDRDIPNRGVRVSVIIPIDIWQTNVIVRPQLFRAPVVVDPAPGVLLPADEDGRSHDSFVVFYRHQRLPAELNHGKFFAAHGAFQGIIGGRGAFQFPSPHFDPVRVDEVVDKPTGEIGILRA